MCNARNHSPSCTCGWGGTGHAGKSPGGWSSQSDIIVNGSSIMWRCYADGFCKPSTCRVCGASVFFVRHNGGSVWFDALGKPWPKHGCFDTHDVQQATERLAKSALNVTSPLYGLVVEVEMAVTDSLDRIIVRCEDDKLTTCYMSSQNSRSSLVGELVVLSRVEEKIVHPNIPASTTFAFPATAEQHYNIGKLYATLGCDSDAIEVFTRCTQLRANFGEAYIEIAKIYEFTRRFYLMGSQMSLQLKKKIVEAYFLAGEAFRNLGKLQEAVEAYRKANLLNPTYPGLCEGLDHCRKKIVPHSHGMRPSTQPEAVSNVQRQRKVQPALNPNYKPKKGSKR